MIGDRRIAAPFGSRLHRAVLAFTVLVMLLAAATIVAGTVSMRAAFPPPNWLFSPLLPFTDFRMPGGAAWWAYVARCEIAWSLALVVAMLALLRVPKRRRGQIAGAIVLLQAVLLSVAFSVRLPFNGGQYLYVAYAQLVQQGYNPYDPPARSARLSPQLRTISTLWGIQREGNVDGRRVVMRDRYGPAWTLGIAAILYPFRDASVETQARVIRLWSALAMLCCSVLIWLTLRAATWSCAALAAFALNPLVVMQTAIGGHNDIVALFFALATVLAVMRNRFAAAGLLAGLSLATKLTFAPLLLPLLVVAWTRRGPRGCAAAALAFGTTVVAAALPFGIAHAYVQPFQDARMYNFSHLAALAYAVSRRVPGMHVPSGIFETAFLVAVCATAAGLAVAALRRRRVAWLEAAMVLLIFSGGRFQPWYAIVLALLLLVRASWSLPLFTGVSLAAQVFERKDFVGTDSDVPFAAFVAIAVASVLAIAFAQRVCLRGVALRLRRPPEAAVQAEARNAATT